MRIDIEVDGGLPEGMGGPELIGKTVEWDWTSAYISIAHIVRIVE